MDKFSELYKEIIFPLLVTESSSTNFPFHEVFDEFTNNSSIKRLFEIISKPLGITSWPKSSEIFRTVKENHFRPSAQLIKNFAFSVDGKRGTFVQHKLLPLLDFLFFIIEKIHSFDSKKDLLDLVSSNQPTAQNKPPATQPQQSTTPTNQPSTTSSSLPLSAMSADDILREIFSRLARTP